MSQNVDIDLSFCFIVCRRWKVGKYNWNIKRDICVQKIKVKILVINSPLPKYKDFRHVYYIIKWEKKSIF